jgi:hypothetical protein
MVVAKSVFAGDGSTLFSGRRPASHFVTEWRQLAGSAKSSFGSRAAAGTGRWFGAAAETRAASGIPSRILFSVPREIESRRPRWSEAE